jgi:hypothetical protein
VDSGQWSGEVPALRNEDEIIFEELRMEVCSLTEVDTGAREEYIF